MPCQHLLEQWALDENVAAQIKWGGAQHLVDRGSLVFTHALLVLRFGTSGAIEYRGEEDEVASHHVCGFDAVRQQRRVPFPVENADHTRKSHRSRLDDSHHRRRSSP
jgi:hypothetical protein